MSDIPRQVLSEALGEHLAGRRILAAAFMTYRLEPAFFEQEVLPVILDMPASHAPAIRLVQLEDALRSFRVPIAVYYDANGLVSSDAGSAKLDWKRISIRHTTGVFHPKNIFLLIEPVEPSEEGARPQSLLVVSLSANITRAGWWENVEACHVELVEEGSRNRLRDALIEFLGRIRRRSEKERDHAALEEILRFLNRTEMRQQRSTDGRLHSHFFPGSGRFLDWVDDVAGPEIRGLCLEVLSPYFDDADECRPLQELLKRFRPIETRVLLPRQTDTGGVTITSELYESVRHLEGVSWGYLPKELVRLGRSEDARERFVHAKVYRFFERHPKREILVVGSVNLTSPAHDKGGNVESAVLVEIEPPRRPEFWLAPESRRADTFGHVAEDQGASTTSGSRLCIRYHWDAGEGEAFWDDGGVSPALRLEAQGLEVLALESLPARTWTPIGSEGARRLRAALGRTSFVTVIGDRPDPVTLLVQEEGMSHKPSLLLQLSVADILRYWSLLTAEQRAAFIEARAPEISGVKDQLVPVLQSEPQPDSFFDRFAGFFHAFGCLERNVRASLGDENERDAVYRLFGRKYDSLGRLLDQIEKDEIDSVDQYVIVLCARQLCQGIERDYPSFWEAHPSDASVLNARVASASSAARAKLAARNPEEFTLFLDWLERWFVRRASAVETAA